MGCIFDEPLEPYICEADWNCKDCPNWVKEPTNGISAHDLVQEILKNNGVVDL